MEGRITQIILFRQLIFQQVQIPAQTDLFFKQLQLLSFSELVLYKLFCRMVLVCCSMFALSVSVCAPLCCKNLCCVSHFCMGGLSVNSPALILSNNSGISLEKNWIKSAEIGKLWLECR